MLLYNIANQNLFYVSASAGLCLYNNASQEFLVDQIVDVF
jgi:hypothetical protein